MIDPKTPVMPGALTLWEREISNLEAEAKRVEAKLDHAKKYLAEVKMKLSI